MGLQIFIGSILFVVVSVILMYKQYRKGRQDMLNHLFYHKHIDAETYRKINLQEEGKKDEKYR